MEFRSYRVEDQGTSGYLGSRVLESGCAYTPCVCCFRDLVSLVAIFTLQILSLLNHVSPFLVLETLHLKPGTLHPNKP